MAPTEHIPKPTYKVGEYALCFHHELLYEAKILDVELNEDDEKDKGYLYRVHYKGWKNTWDDWVPEERLRRDNEENRQLQKDIALQQKRPKAAKKANANGSNRASEDRYSSAPVAGRGTKRGRDYDIEKVGNRNFFGQHESASGPLPRGIWDSKKIDVANEPISWKHADGNSFRASKDWRNAKKADTGPAPDPASYTSRNEDKALWKLLAKTVAAPKPEKFIIKTHEWKRGRSVAMNITGIRLEPLEPLGEPVASKHNRKGKSSSASPIGQIAPPISVAELAPTIQPSIEPAATVDHSMRRNTSKSTATKGPLGTSSSRSLRTRTQKRARSQEQGQMRTQPNSATGKGPEGDKEPASPTRFSEKRETPAAPPYESNRPKRSRFLPTGAQVKPDGTVVHVPEWVLEQEARKASTSDQSVSSLVTSKVKRPSTRESLSVNTCLHIEKSRPSSAADLPQKRPFLPLAPLTGTSSASSLSTPPPSQPTSPRLALAHNVDASEAIAVNEIPKSTSIAAPTSAPETSLEIVPENSLVSLQPRDQSAPISEANVLTSPVTGTVPQESLPTPRSSPGPVADTISSSPSTTNTAAAPISSATSTQSASSEIVQSTGTASEISPSTCDAAVASSCAPGPVRRSARDKKPTKRALEFQDLRASEASGTKREETYIHRPTIRIPVPDTIKALLVDDWENVTKNLTLAPLPHAHPVSEVLKAYLAEEQSKRESSSVEFDRVEEVTAGVKEYFDKSLGVMLLYKFERQQYKDILAQTIDSGDVQWEGKSISDVYGAEHLCRLFVSFPELIAQTNMDQQSVSALREELAKFMSWLAKNAEDWFAVDKYESPSNEYTEKARAL